MTLWSHSTDWGRVIVRQEGTLRKLVFASETGETEESRLDTSAPTRPLLEYVRQMVALTALWEANSSSPPEHPRFLVVGLGGASLSNALAQAFPGSEVVSIEIEPVVAEAARKFFFYRESALVQTVIDDARHYLENHSGKFDVIYLDAFDGVGVPPTLRTLEFARLLHQNLEENGAVIANIHFTPQEPSLRYRKALSLVFPESYITVGIAQGIGLYTEFPVSKAALLEDEKRWNERYGMELSQVITGRHQDDLDSVHPFRD
ncbi:MAG: fused MFS/spermidine synthase [Candidatus Eremiobacteraeota bacterium]|nr:fused MFS/spermidine synthase [Candidatus Eremiobacteraeota bacterium]